MKTLSSAKLITALVLLTLTSASLQAQVVIDTEPNGSQTSYTWTLGLNGSGVYNTADGQAELNSGSFTGGSPNDSFQVVITAASNFDQASATSAIAASGSDDVAFLTYINGLTISNLGAVAAGGFGVDPGATGDSTIGGVNEVAIFTFGSYSLNANTRVSMTGLTFELNTLANDDLDWFFYDASTSTVTAQLLNQNINGIPLSLSLLNIEAGDKFILAGSDVGNWRVTGVGFDLTTVPEPSNYALLAAGFVGLVLFRRRRHG